MLISIASLEMQIKATLRFLLPQLEWERSTKQPLKNTRADIRSREPSVTLGVSNASSYSGNQCVEPSKI